MKKTMKYLSIIALALVGAVMTGCSSDDDNIDTPKQPENKDNNVVTLTTTIGRDNNAGAKTRALAPTGEKTFAVGEQIAIVYTNTSGATVKGESEALTASDILESGKKANFTFTLENPDRSKEVTYIYPAAMADDDGSVNTGNLATQDGTLAYISSDLDLATYNGPWVDEKSLPVGTLSNQLAFLCLALKNYNETQSLTSSITRFTLSDGTHTYNITRTAGAGPIYVAMLPTDNATIEVTATNGKGRIYSKSLTGKTYLANNGYTLAWKMTEYIEGQFTVSSTNKKVYFSTSNLNATTNNNGTTWSWHFVDTQYARVGGQDKDGNGTLTGNNYINGNGIVTNDGNGHNIDLFGWSTSATHLGIHISAENSTYGGAFADWGSAPEVANCIGTGWRTLNKDEWGYLMDTREGYRYAKASINGTRHGFIILPDGWTNTSPHTLNNINNASAEFTDNTITAANWISNYEAYGAVFLPVTGQRSGTTVTGDDSELHYWSSTIGTSDTNAYPLVYNGGDKLVYNTVAGRKNGFSVRLVRDVK